MRTRRNAALAALCVAAIAAPSLAMAKPGNGNGNGPVKGVSYVFKGVYGTAGLVSVTSGNAHATKAGLVGTDVQFDLSAASLSVGDTNGDGVTDVTDVVTGDRVVVKAKLPMGNPGVAPYVARQLVDQTHP